MNSIVICANSVFSYLEYILDLISTVTLAVSLYTLFLKIKRNRKLYYIAESYGIHDKKEKRRFIKSFKKCIKQNYEINYTLLNYQSLKKVISKSTYIYLNGPSGVGKTTAMIRLCCDFRNTLLHFKRESIYISFNKQSLEINEIVDFLHNEVLSIKNREIYLFCDALDELRGIDKIDNAFISIINRMRDLVYNKEIHFIFASRLEAFSDPSKPKNLGFCEVRVMPFTPKQAYSALCKITYSSHVKRIFKQHISKNQKQSIFTNPILVQFISTLVKSNLFEKKMDSDILTVYDTCVYQWIALEHKKHVIQLPASHLSYDEFVERQISILSNAAHYMFENRTNKIRISALGYENAPDNIILRNLFRKLDDSYIMYIHDSLFSYFLALHFSKCQHPYFYKYLSNNQLTYNFFVRIMLANTRIQNMLNQYTQFNISNSQDYIEILNSDTVNFVAHAELDVRLVLNILINVKYITINGITYDYKEIDRLRDGVLVSPLYTPDLGYLSLFGYMIEIYAQGNGLTKLSQHERFTFLKKLDITNNPVEQIETITDFSLDELSISVYNPESIDKVADYANAKVIKIDYRLFNPLIASDRLLCNFRKGVRVLLYKSYPFTKKYIMDNLKEKNDVQSLSNAWTLDYLSFPQGKNRSVLFVTIIYCAFLLRKTENFIPVFREITRNFNFGCFPSNDNDFMSMRFDFSQHEMNRFIYRCLKLSTSVHLMMHYSAKKEYHKVSEIVKTVYDGEASLEDLFNYGWDLHGSSFNSHIYCLKNLIDFDNAKAHYESIKAEL